MGMSRAIMADVSLIDPLMLKTKSPELMAATGMDALTHAIGAYVSSLSWPMTEPHAIHAIELVFKHLVDAVKTKDIKALEGMAIAAYATGAEQGYIYIRAEYPLAIERLQIAIKQANKSGLLGAGILEGPTNFSIDIRIGAGAFVCGEETALMASIQGDRGQPWPRPLSPFLHAMLCHRHRTGSSG